MYRTRSTFASRSGCWGAATAPDRQPNCRVDGAVGDEGCPSLLSVALRANVIPPGVDADDPPGAETDSGDPGAETTDDTGGRADGGSVVEQDPTAPGDDPGDDGCGCDLTAGPSRTVPLGSFWLILLSLGVLLRLRESPARRP